MTISRIESDLLREEMYFEELENGLKIFFMPRKGYTNNMQYLPPTTAPMTICLLFGRGYDNSGSEGIVHFGT